MASLLCLFLFLACQSRDLAHKPAPAAVPDLVEDSTIAFLEKRVASDQDDYPAWNRLGGTYMRALRLTGNHDYLDGALRAAGASLKAMPAEQNRGGLLLMARARQANHEFAAAAGLAQQLLGLDETNAEYWALRGDALMELGHYEEAERAFGRMRETGGPTLGAETRSARMAVLHGRTDDARAHFEAARLLAQTPEDVAWCEWQLGELAFSNGDYRKASEHYDAAIAAYPRSIAALGAKAKVLAAQDQVFESIAMYERATALDPVPPFVAALSDLYRIGRYGARADALLQRITENAQSPRDRRLDRRHLATIYADHDIRPEEAYELAAADYAERQDVGAADTLAWAALKSGRVPEAQRLIVEALRLGTRDARLFYHAGMIANAAGDKAGARAFLSRALELSPCFDFVQAKIAKKTLASL